MAKTSYSSRTLGTSGKAGLPAPPTPRGAGHGNLVRRHNRIQQSKGAFAAVVEVQGPGRDQHGRKVLIKYSPAAAKPGLRVALEKDIKGDLESSLAAFITMKPAGYQPSIRTELLTRTLGATKLARLLGVAKSQPTRWRKGHEAPSGDSARRLVDLDIVVARAQLLFTDEVVAIWLESSNQHLGGRSPIDVLRWRGPSEVLDALDAEMAGGYA
jgi:uncharacterized protein (DUF2384 family)